MGSLDKKYSDSFQDIKIEIDKVPSGVSSRASRSDHSEEDGHESEPIYQGHYSPGSNFGAAKESSQDSCCRTTLAFVFLFYNMTLNLFILAVVHERVPMQIKTPLPDIAFDALPKADWALDVAEYIIVVQVTSIMLLLLFHRYR